MTRTSKAFTSLAVTSGRDVTSGCVRRVRLCQARTGNPENILLPTVAAHYH